MITIDWQCIVLVVGLIALSAFLRWRANQPRQTEDGYLVKMEEFTVGTIPVRYAIAIPDSYAAAGEPIPLILALHYGGTVTPSYGRDFLELLVRPALGELNAIIVAPNCPSPSEWSGPRNERAVLALLERLTTDYIIDPERILLMGYSKGAKGTWDLALRHPERFSAIIPISGAPPDDIASRAEALINIPVYAIHSGADELFPIDMVEQAIDALQEQGVTAELHSVENISHYNTGRFVAPLSEAIPWLKEVWALENE